MNATSANFAAGVDEMAHAGLAAAPSQLVKPPRVAASPCALECRYVQTVPLPSRGRDGYLLVIGEVVGIHIDDRFISDGRVDTAAMRPIARMGYSEYAVVTPETRFSLRRPG